MTPFAMAAGGWPIEITGMPVLDGFLCIFIVCFILINFIAVYAGVSTYAERKIAGHMQARVGPYRIWWHGFGVWIADALKLMIKEDIIAKDTDKLLFKLSPYVVFAGSHPRGVSNGFYGEAVRDLKRRGIHTILDSEGEPLRLGTEAEPWLVSPNQPEAEGLVGQELNDDEDFMMALDVIADRGAQNVLITQPTGCVARFREERRTRRFRARSPRLEALSAVGAGDTLLAGLIAARLEGRATEEALAYAVAAGAVSTLQVGAGRFEPRDLARLAAQIQIEELEAVAR